MSPVKLHWFIRYCYTGFVSTFIASGVLAATHAANAQITPDGTLGTETSTVNSAVINGLPSRQIEGGAIRGVNLFHSFQEFNVGDRQRVYFANPTGIQTILSRVTGTTPSNIMGTLGVQGTANLFLINPNGILFGPNARLDIAGSFTATTARKLEFGNGLEFSATNPQAPPLLTVNIAPGLQRGSIQPGSTLTNHGNLTTGQDLILEADRLDLQGQLTAGRDLTLNAQDTAQIRDTVTAPFLAQSGRDLTIQGNQGVDILALNHPSQFPFQSGSDLRLISDGTISGDAHFSSGGNFQVQSVSGQLANFTSLYDPIISSTGNVDIAARYTGASLLIESQGNVRIQERVTITRPDNRSTFVGNDAVLRTQPGLIIRSGQPNLVYGGINQNNPPALSNNTIPSGITLAGAVRVQPNAQGGVVRLTAAKGGITFHSIDASGGVGTGDNGGLIELIANGDITNTGSFMGPGIGRVALGSFSQTTSRAAGNGGRIDLSSTTGNIRIQNGAVNSRSYLFPCISVGVVCAGKTTGDGGDIALTSTNGSISLINSPINSSSLSDSTLGDSRNGGDIALTATNGNIFLNNSPLKSNSSSPVFARTDRKGGDITVSATNGNISLSNSDLDSSASRSSSSHRVNGGATTFTAINGNISLSNSNLDSSASGQGNGGAMSVTATNGNISFSDARATSDSRSISIAGNGGAMTFAAINGNIFLSNLQLDSFSFSDRDKAGNGGNIAFSAAQGNIVSSNPSTLSSFAVSNGNVGSGNGGVVTLTAQNQINNLEILTQSSNGLAGAVEINGLGNLTLTDTRVSTSKTVSVSIPSSSGRFQTITFTVGTAGQSGAVKVTGAGDLTFDETVLQSSTQGTDPAGDVQITSPGVVTFQNNSQIMSNTKSSGTAGSINIQAGQAIRLTSGAALSATTDSAGTAGNITLQSPQLTLEEDAQITTTATATATNPQGGGSITLNASSMDLRGKVGVLAETKGQSPAGILSLNPYQADSTLDIRLVPGALISASTSGAGQGGDLNLTAPQSITIGGAGKLAVETSKMGNAGNINIVTQQLTLTGGVELSASTSGSGQAGGFNVIADQVTLNQGARMTTNTTSSGTAGSILLTVTDALRLTGAGTGLFASTDPNSTGNGGNIIIDPHLVRIEDGATIAVNSQGSGTGGSISLQADRLELDHRGSIVAETDSSQGGDITLNIRDLLLMRHNSLISATAGIAQAKGNGGNITINAPFVIGVLFENSDIFANAFEGNGGRIIINAPGGIYGLKYQPKRTQFRTSPPVPNAAFKEM